MNSLNCTIGKITKLEKKLEEQLKHRGQFKIYCNHCLDYKYVSLIARCPDCGDFDVRIEN